MTWKEFKEWMESHGVTDDMIFDEMDYNGDLEEMTVDFDKSFRDMTIIHVVYR